MSGNRKPKYNYKLFNTRTKKYMSWNHKATWSHRGWLAARLHGQRVHEIEVHIFPVDEPIKMTATAFLQEQAMADLEKRSKKLSREAMEKKRIEHQQFMEDVQKMKELQERIERYKAANNQ